MALMGIILGSDSFALFTFSVFALSARKTARKVDQLGDAWVIIKPVCGKVRVQIDTKDGRGLYVDLTPERVHVAREDLRFALNRVELGDA